MNDYIIANDHSGINSYAWIKYAMRANLDIVTHIHILIYLRVIADLCVVAYIGKITNIHLFAEFRGKEPSGVKTAMPSLPVFECSCIMQQISQGTICIIHSDHGGNNWSFWLEILIYQ